MSLIKRLKKIEAKRRPDKKLLIVRYPSEVTELTYRGRVFERLQSESEDAFVDRVVAIVESIEDRPEVSYLVGNF